MVTSLKDNNVKSKYIILGVVFGSGIGLCAGILINNIVIGLVLGAGIGLVFGTVKIII